MQSDISQLISKLHDAALVPEAWPAALRSFTESVGVAGAAYIVCSKATGRVNLARFSGLSAALESAYVDHYAALDPYSPPLSDGWVTLSECPPEQLLRRSEWYNDFVLTCGVRDILAARLIDTASHCVFFGLHQQIGRTFPGKITSILNLVAGPLKQAARRHTQQLLSSHPTAPTPEFG